MSLLGPEPDGQMTWDEEAISAGDATPGEVASAVSGAGVGGIVALGWVESLEELVDQAWLAVRSWTIDLARSPSRSRRACRLRSTRTGCGCGAERGLNVDLHVFLAVLAAAAIHAAWPRGREGRTSASA